MTEAPSPIPSETASPEYRGGKRRVIGLSLHVTIFFVFASLTLLLSVGIISYSHFAGQRAASSLADQILDQASNSVMERTNLLFSPLFSIADAMPLVPGIGTTPTLANHPSVSFLIDTLDRYEQISAAYLGFANGDFFQIISVKNKPGDNTPGSTVYLSDAPPGTRFAIRTIYTAPTGHRVAIWKYLNVNRHILGSRTVTNPPYDPRLRPWYRAANATQKTISVDPYRYDTGEDRYGITIAKRFDGAMEGVFGVDLALAGLSEFLEEQSRSNRARLSSYIVTGDGALLASSNEKHMYRGTQSPETTAAPTDADPILEWIRTHGGQDTPSRTTHNFTLGKTTYLFRTRYLPQQYVRDATLTVVAREDAFIGPIQDASELTIYISGMAVILFLPIIILVSRRVSRPLRLLAEEATSIRNLDFAKAPHISGCWKSTT